jgi:hypothetical protein
MIGFVNEKALGSSHAEQFLPYAVTLQRHCATIAKAITYALAERQEHQKIHLSLFLGTQHFACICVQLHCTAAQLEFSLNEHTLFTSDF